MVTAPNPEAAGTAADMPLARNAKSLAAHNWTLSLTNRRMVVERIRDTDMWVARIRQTPGVSTKLAVTGESEVECECALTNKVYQWAYDILTRGKELPVIEPVKEPPADVLAVVRRKTLRLLLKARMSDWGWSGGRFPSDADIPLLHDIDRLISRHASELAVL